MPLQLLSLLRDGFTLRGDFEGLFGRSIARGCGFTTKLHPHVIKIFNFEFVYARVMPLQLLSLLRDGFTLRGNSQPIRQKYCSWLWFYHSPAHALYFCWTKSIISRFRLQINHFFDRIGQYSSMSYIIYINEAVITCQFHKFQWRVPVCYGTLEVFREGEKCLYIQLF